MPIEQTVEIPPDHRLFIEVPPEIPAGKAIVSFTAISDDDGLECAKKMWANNRAHQEELKVKLKNLQGSLGESAFDALDGVTYQRKVREEWDA